MKPTLAVVVIFRILTAQVYGQITDTSITTYSSEQSEPTIASNPFISNQLAIAANDWRGGGWCIFSTNGGTNWVETLVRTEQLVDPSLAFGLNNRVFYSYLRRLGGTAAVSWTTNFGINWNHVDVGSGGNDDKPFMAVDNRTNGNGYIYVSWVILDRYVGSYTIKVARSTNQGLSFPLVTTLDYVAAGKGTLLSLFPHSMLESGSDVARPLLQGPMPVVGPNGEVYVIWAYAGQESYNDGFFKIAKSTDAGTTFSMLPNGPSLTWVDSYIAGVQPTPIPSLAIDPNTGYLHLGYTDCDAPGCAERRVYYTRSTNGGNTWETRQDIAGFDFGWQFFPWVSVDKTGRVSFTFMNMPNTSSRVVDAYVAESYDQGVHWANPIRVSSQSSNANNSNQKHHYMGAASQSGGKVNVVWTDYRNQNPDIFFSQANTITYLASQGKSTSTNATATNSQRKLVRESTGKLHMVFESGGEIFYRSSTNDGTTWQTTNRISPGTGDNTYPSITERSNYIYAVWQRQNGSNWDLLFNYSTNGGTTWLASPITLVSNFSCPTPGPQPVILAGAPSSSFELMAVYRHSNGLSSLRSTSYPVGGNWTGPVLVTGTNQYSQNPSLTYRSNGYPPFRLAWDENNKINYSMYYPDTWTTPYDIGNGAYMASNKTNPSISVTSDNDIDIVWEGTYSGTRSIITNRNLSSVYYGFQNYSNNYYKPSVTGHVNGRATVVWHDNSLNVRKAIYDPAYGWYYIGLIIGTNGANASASVMNQQGGDAKVVWTEGTSSPYTIHLDGTLLNKPIAKGGSENSTLTLLDGKVHRQLILRDSVTSAFLAVQLEAPRLVGASGEESVEFIAVDDTMRYTPQQIFSFLETKPFALTSRVNAFAMRRMIRAQGIGTLASQGRLRVELVNAQDGQVISSFGHFDLIENGGGITQDDSIRVPVNRTTGQYKLRLKAENLALTVPSRRASLVNIFVGQSEGQRISKSNEVMPTSSALLGNYPNPFNPATTIRFAIPQNEYVTLKVYDMLGREVATLVNGVRDAGTYDEVFDASKLSSGVYIYKLTAGNFTASKKLAAVK
jgi:hypothetical protein